MPRTKSKPETNGHADLPLAIEAEARTIGCCLIEPSSVQVCNDRFAGGQPFYDGRHEVLFNELRAMTRERKPIALDTVYQRLRDRHLLKAVGLEYLQSLPDLVPSAANLPSYLDTVVEKWRLRRYQHICEGVLDRIRNFDGNWEDFRYATDSDLQELVTVDARECGEIFSPSQLDAFDVEHDPNCLIGRRWICRGSKLLIVAPSGHGKSTLAMQLAVQLAIGTPFCGIVGAHPLSSVIIGDENDQGDLAEMFQGVRDGLKLNSFDDEEKFRLLDANLKFFHWPAQNGEQFLSAVQNWLIQHPTDIAWLDPLVSYADVDITKQDGAAQFLRRGLSRISQQTGVVWAVIHHTPKPQGDARPRAKKLSEYQYAGAGSYDLSGWARATMTLEEVQDRTYRLVLAKRGERARATHPDGTPTRMLWLRHADGKRVCWEQIEPPAEPESKQKQPKEKRKPLIEQVAALNMHEVLSTIPEEGESAASLGERFQAFAIRKGVRISLTLCRTQLLFLLGSEQRDMLRLDTRSQKWFRGKNA